MTYYRNCYRETKKLVLHWIIDELPQQLDNGCKSVRYNCELICDVRNDEIFLIKASILMMILVHCNIWIDLILFDSEIFL